MTTEPNKYNFSIIVNHGDINKFGCSRRCSYCNWQRLKTFGKSLPDITLENFKDAKGYITISGGGDPLWSGDQNSVMDYIPFLLTQIVAKGFKPRIITREILNFKEICDNIDINIYLSLSYDTIVIQEIYNHPELIKFIRGLVKLNLIEMTVVAEPDLALKDLITPIFEIAKLQEYLGVKFPITIRENLRSIKYVKKDFVHGILKKIKETLVLGNDIPLRWLPAKVCLEDNVYIVSPQKCFGYNTHLSGYDITPDYVEAFNILSNNMHYMIFGSVARYIAAYKNKQEIYESEEYKSIGTNTFLPIDLPKYSDIDVFVEKEFEINLIEKLRSLGFTKCHKVNPNRIKVCHPLDCGFIIDINLISNIEIAKIITSEALYRVNRLGICNGEILTFKGFEYMDLMTNKTKALPHKWNYLNFTSRDKSEAQVLNKLISRGWKVEGLSIPGKILQSIYRLQAHIKRFIQRKFKHGRRI